MTQASHNVNSVAPVVASDAETNKAKSQQKRMYFVRVLVCFLSFGFVFPDALNG